MLYKIGRLEEYNSTEDERAWRRELNDTRLFIPYPFKARLYVPTVLCPTLPAPPRHLSLQLNQ